MRTPDMIPAVTRRGVKGLKDSTGRWVWLPRLAGAAGPPDPPADPPAPVDPPADPPAPADPPVDPPADPPLGEAGERALADERKARKKAEKEAKDAQTELQRRQDAELSENERLKKESDENRVKAETATVKARNANLLAALADKGLVGGKARAAARLLDTVEFDEDDDEPTNLDAAIDAAKATYGDASFTPDEAPKPTPPNLNGGSGHEPGPEPQLTAEELQAANDAGMTPQKYEEMKGVKTYEDWVAAQKRLQAAQQ